VGFRRAHSPTVFAVVAVRGQGFPDHAPPEQGLLRPPFVRGVGPRLHHVQGEALGAHRRFRAPG